MFVDCSFPVFQGDSAPGALDPSVFFDPNRPMAWPKVGSIVLPLFHYLFLGGAGGLAMAISLRKASAVACIAAGMLALSMTDKEMWGCEPII